MEVILDKINYNILHCFTNYGLNGEDIENNEIENEKYIEHDILKIFLLYIIKNNKLKFISKSKKK